MASTNRVSNEKKNLNRLAGEFLVASRLTQRGYMVTLQWGNTISYDILAFDKQGKIAFIEVKSTSTNRVSNEKKNLNRLAGFLSSPMDASKQVRLPILADGCFKASTLTLVQIPYP